MKTAVTGAFSYSGKYIARRLLERGDEVITLTGHPDRPDPFGGRVRAFPLDFADEAGLEAALCGVDVFINTYWVRFDRHDTSHQRAVENTQRLMQAAVRAGVKRIVHISITNPSPDSPLPYFWGKAVNERIVIETGIPYAILRPTVLFGKEDILINNIAWIVRRLPVFLLPGDGSYRLQPIYVDDLAELAVECAGHSENLIWDAVGPETFTFRQLVEQIGAVMGRRRLLLPAPPRMAWLAAQLLGLVTGDVVLTWEEVLGLMANLLVSTEPPRGKTRLSDWLYTHRQEIGKEYASEVRRHYA
jgi:NADH dehydrogenase